MANTGNILNLYLVLRPDHGYDENDAHVIAAQDEYGARLIAGGAAGDEGGQVWHEPTTTVTHIGEANPGVVGIVLTSFNAG